MSEKRIARLNSLLKEVISEVIHRELKNPHMPPFVTIVGVEIVHDMSHAKVFVSVLGSEREKKKAMEILKQSSGFIALRASKMMTIKFFPVLAFHLDEGMERQSHIDTLLKKIEDERTGRGE